MKIELNETEYCKVSVHYEEDFEGVSQKKGEVLNKFKTLNIPGFRPGKAPIDAVQMHFKKEINEQLKNELAEAAYLNVLFEKKIKPFGQPVFTSLNLETFKFTCDFEIYKKPDFELGEYKNLEIPKPHLATTSQELTQKMFEELRRRYGETSPFNENDFVQMHDSLIIDYQGVVDENEIDFLSAKGDLLTVGATPIAGFDENLLGMKIGETRKFKILAPPNAKPEIAGKEVEFTVFVQTASRIQPLPLGDELAKKIGFDSFRIMEEHGHATANERISKLENKEITDQVFKVLVSKHNFSVPTWLSISEAKLIASNNGLTDWEAISDPEKENFVKNAEDNVKLSLILEKIREIEPEAQLSDEEAINIVKQQVGQGGKNLQDVFKKMVNSGYLPMLLGKIRDEYTINFIVSKVKIIE